jgi:hypothetical protein
MKFIGAFTNIWIAFLEQIFPTPRPAPRPAPTVIKPAGQVKAKAIYKEDKEQKLKALMEGLLSASELLATKPQEVTFPGPDQFPQLAPASTPSFIGVWGDISTIKAAVCLPDPAIVRKAKLDAERARRQELISMYREVVHIGHLGLSEELVKNIKAQREAKEIREERKGPQPPRRRLRVGDEDEEDKDLLGPLVDIIIGGGQEVYRPVDEASEDEDEWAGTIVAPAPRSQATATQPQVEDTWDAWNQDYEG